jgi:hypothetical protein
MRSIEGLIIIVQEGRFQLVDDAGVAHLFLLGHAAAADPEQLVPLQSKQARVRVKYRPAEGLIANIAERLVLLDR